MNTEEVGLATGLIALQLVKGLLSILRNAENSPSEH